MDKGAMVTLTCTFAMGWTECLLARIDVHLLFPFVGMVFCLSAEGKGSEGSEFHINHPSSLSSFHSESLVQESPPISQISTTLTDYWEKGGGDSTPFSFPPRRKTYGTFG